MNVIEMRDGDYCLAQWVWVESTERWVRVHTDALLDPVEERMTREVVVEGRDPRSVEMPAGLLGYDWRLLDCKADFERTRESVIDESTGVLYRNRQSEDETGEV